VLLALVAFSIYISWVDVKTHRISNSSLLFGAVAFTLLNFVEDRSLFWVSALLTLVFAPLALKAKVGAGDIKLTTILSLFFLPSNLSTLQYFLSAFAVISSTLLICNVAKVKSLRSSIALAPAICGAVIWCAR
jgi:Flp pilus assembly protein protease CpaA